ncbi:peptidoglycan DD-metalloendopeptidase family protein [Kordiimonas sp. SCSIO 12603]|uniref:murein hydrolase activator EnvC family protein n=1 Tax=Kordiimonas sp. SCSIO 12603 TaxID=2829596 RepID=UPI0021081209|nr:peptidoglycan DD-metalloendopeptidase family protein [Kordiimonas sp. SCSIO 12603]UTW59733.1 peptidoglycan DD-metalloendopeptidase family protein [Kordiimonas sp. SCSIO 12603]
MPLLKRQYKGHFAHSRLVLSGLLATTLLVSQPLLAQEKNEAAKRRLEEITKTIKETEAQKQELEDKSTFALSEAERLSIQLVELAQSIRSSEANASRLESRIEILEIEVRDKEQRLDGRQDELLELLSALERLSKRPAALALLQPREALTTARSASLMGTIIPDIREKAQALRGELTLLANMQKELGEERFALKNTLEQLTLNQGKIDLLVRQRRSEAQKASQQAEALERELKKFARDAKNLQDLIAKLEQQAAKAKRLAEKRPKVIERANASLTGVPINRRKGSLIFPAIGRLISHFGDKEPVGNAQGIKIETRLGAQVVAPYEGKIVFAGPFRDYGQLLIIEHAGGYHSLLAGLDELSGAVGQWVLTGEPLGTMALSDETDQLYLEMRHKGRAINPEPWLQKQLAFR